MMAIRTLGRRTASHGGMQWKKVHNTMASSAMLHRMKMPTVSFGSARSFTNISRRIDRIDTDHIIYGILGINGIVWFMWKTADTHEKKKFMIANFITSSMHLANGRLHTLITAAFSHMDGSHLAVNSLGLYFFGREVCSILGPKRFLALYLGSAAIASLCEVISQGNRRSTMLGASGAVNAITAFSICMFPHNTILVMMVIPLPAYICGGLFILRDLWGAASNNDSNIGHIAHLSGAAVGMAYYRYVTTRRRFF